MAQNTFDARIAETYEEKWPELFEPAVVDPAVDFLAGLAGSDAGPSGSDAASSGPGPAPSGPGPASSGSGAALEFGVGTGRLALPLSRRGVRVHGIDLSTAMIAQLRAKPGAERVGVTVGDFATTRVDGTFALAYLVRNTITNLTTQDEQVECFRNAAAHLGPGGCFVIEVYVPELRRLPPGQTVHPFAVTPAHLGFEEYDVAAQLAVSHHYWTAGGQVEIYSSTHRYVWPAELDLMARLAGMALHERWAGWGASRSPARAGATSRSGGSPPRKVQQCSPVACCRGRVSGRVGWDTLHTGRSV
ncbi:class I SAM-dependent DNA methyltransferase [Nonomuraea sp. GTA35]|uniref:class I SAM-dependent DNA methyltransferase n=1 Tax=Nonomuraea sp. GTA35 TaxID=1676746 RepID=UPI0035C1F0FC